MKVNFVFVEDLRYNLPKHTALFGDLVGMIMCPFFVMKTTASGVLKPKNEFQRPIS